jgi:hypothetical protein
MGGVVGLPKRHLRDSQANTRSSGAEAGHAASGQAKQKSAKAPISIQGLILSVDSGTAR